MGYEAAGLYATIGADLKGLQVGARQADRIGAGIHKNMLKWAGATGAAWGGIQIAKGIVRETTVLDTKLHATNSLFGVTGRTGRKSFASLEGQVKKLSTTMGIAQSTLADGLYQAISAGVPRDNAMEFMRIASEAAIGGITDTETAVDALSTAVNSFKSQNLDAQRAADVMFQTVNRGKVEFPELARFMGEATSYAAAAGVRFDDFGAAIATMTAKGVRAPQTMTALKQALQAVMRPTEQMTKAYKKLGVSGWDQLLKKSGSLQGAFNRLAKSADGDKKTLIEMFGSVDAFQAVLQLTGANAKDAAADLAALRGSGGSAKKAFDEMNQSVARAGESAKVHLQNIGVMFASHVLPQVAAGVAELDAKLAGAMSDPAFEQRVQSLAADAARLGGVMASAASTAYQHREAIEALVVSLVAAKLATVAYTAVAARGAAVQSAVAFAQLAVQIRSARDAMALLSMTMSVTPIGAIATVAGLAAGGLMLMRDGGIGAASALDQAAGAARGLNSAIDQLAQDELGAQRAALELRSAQMAASGAHLAAASAAKQHGRGSREYKDAALQAAQADLRVKQAKLDKAGAEKKASDSASKATGETKKSTGATEQLIKRQQQLARMLASGKTDGGGAKASAHMRARMEELRAEYDRNAEQLKKMQSQAGKAAGQVDQLGASASTNKDKIAQLRAEIERLQSKTITVTVNTKRSGGSNPFTSPILSATGGPISGPGTGTSDSIPAMLSDGEYVINARSARKAGPLLDAINSGRMPGYARGGKVKKSRSERASDAWSAWQSGWQVRESAADLRIARAEATPGTDDDAKALRAMKSLQGAKLASLRTFRKKMARRGLLTNDVKSSIASESASAIRMQQQIAQQIADLPRSGFDRLKAGFDEKLAAGELALARAEGTTGTEDDIAAKTALRDLARSEAASFQSYLSTTKGLTGEQRTSILQEISNALRQANQLDADLGSGASSGSTGGVGVETDQVALLQRQSGSSGGGGGSMDVTVTGGDGSGVGYVPDPALHPVFFDANQINDLTFYSAGVGVLITGIPGWDDAEMVRSVTESRSGQDGELFRELLMGASPVVIRGLIVGSSKQDLEIRWRALKAKLQPSASVGVLKMPDPTYTGVLSTSFGLSMTGYQRRECRVVASPKRGQQVGRYGHEWTVELRAADPRRYSDVETTVTSTTIASGGGFTAPMAAPLSIGGGFTGGDVVCDNSAGDYETPMTIKLYGPSTNPVVENVNGDGILSFTANGGLVLASGDWAEIDMLNHTVYLNGDTTESLFQYLDFSTSVWWLLPEGSSSVRYRASSITAPAQLTVSFRTANL